MHRDIAAGELLGPYALDEPLGLELEAPQAPIAAEQLTTTAAIDQV